MAAGRYDRFGGELFCEHLRVACAFRLRDWGKPFRDKPPRGECWGLFLTRWDECGHCVGGCGPLFFVRPGLTLFEVRELSARFIAWLAQSPSSGFRDHDYRSAQRYLENWARALLKRRPEERLRCGSVAELFDSLVECVQC
jgi:hypothetical protein